MRRVGPFQLNRTYCCDAMRGMRRLPDRSVQTCVTSPLYWGLRNCDIEGTYGVNETMEEYLDKMVVLFREVRRVLKPDGTFWLNMNDAYAGGGSKARPGKKGGGTALFRADAGNIAGANKAATGLKPKDLCGLPWRLALALQADGWWLRCDIIWYRSNMIPESAKDRPSRTHQYIFLLTPSASCYYDREAVRVEERGYLRSVWRVASHAFRMKRCRTCGVVMTQGAWDKLEPAGERRLGPKTRRFHEDVKDRICSACATSEWVSHYAGFPEELIEPCVRSSTGKSHDVVLDPFMGSGTTGAVALKFRRHFLGFELNPDYVAMANWRTRRTEEEVPE